jgi:hypothetical protein
VVTAGYGVAALPSAPGAAREGRRSSMPVVLHGPAYSTYARSVRLALDEKGVP